MNSLRVLLVDADGRESARVTTLLLNANHSVLGTSGLDEAAEALQLQKFDAVLLGASVPPAAVPEFAASLRDLEQRQRLDSRIPVLSISPGVADGWSPAVESPPDGYLSRRFGPETLSSAIHSLANGVQRNSTNFGTEPQVFLSDEFREQCAGEPQLMAEIIDLFLIEQQDQMAAMVHYLEEGQYEQLSYVAHTLKGSLGSLHARAGRQCAEWLEDVAKQQDSDECRSAMLALEAALSELEPALQTFRSQFAPQ
jgi:HPt (histidine-containing phosphotransfer) domain-containing protein